MQIVNTIEYSLISLYKKKLYPTYSDFLLLLLQFLKSVNYYINQSIN